MLVPYALSDSGAGELCVRPLKTSTKHSLGQQKRKLMSSTRSDHTDYLVHWTKGTPEEAFEALSSIAVDEEIRGGIFGVRSGDNCICFSEAPVDFFHERKGDFKPFGIRVSKRWIFSLGGRPVIYQPIDEYKLLPPNLSWRHVDFDLTGLKRRDYSWQREWRLRQDRLHLPVDQVTLVIPQEEYREELKRRFENENYTRGLASCDPYGYGMYAPLHETSAGEYRVEVIPTSGHTIHNSQA